MTYWYTGVQAAISAAREVHPRVPVLLGGIYARLCSDHALKSCGADQVLQTGAVPAVIAALKALGAAPAPAADAPAAHPYPAFDLLHGRDYVCLLASHGCPYNCHYCASHLLNPIFERRRPEQVTAEILYWHANHAVTDFAFYDDALLVPPQAGIRSVLEEVIRRAPGLRFHTPNALHLREIDREMAVLMRAAGFQTIRLGLESADFAKGHRLDEKVGAGEFERAVGHLLDAGFRGEQLGAYILAGLPGQQTAAVKAALNLVDQAGILPFLAEYSPIPGTILWPAAVAASRYDLTREPLYHNNTLLPCWDAAQRAQLPELRLRVRTIRERVRSDRNGLAKNGRMRGLPNPVA